VTLRVKTDSVSDPSQSGLEDWKRVVGARRAGDGDRVFYPSEGGAPREISR